MNTLDGVMVIGLTGQTGAGKSTVSKVFVQNGFRLCYLRRHSGS